MKYIFFLFLFVLGNCYPALAIDKKDLREYGMIPFELGIPVPEFIKKNTGNTTFDVWWILSEYWRNAVPASERERMQIEKIIEVLESYSIFAILQGDITPSGDRFFSKDKIARNLTISYTIDKLQNKIILETLEINEIPPELASSFSEIRPIITSIFDQRYRQNYRFFFVEKKGINRLLSPCKQGQVKVELSSDRYKNIPFTIDTPLDSLHRSRICPKDRDSFNLSISPQINTDEHR